METPFIEVRRLAIARGAGMLQRGLDFELRQGQILAIMGDGGAGKSTLLRVMAGLQAPAAGDVLYSGRELWSATERERSRLTTQFGILLSGGALLSTRTLIENVMLPLQLHTGLAADDVVDVARLKLALMGLAGRENRYPSEVDGSQRIWAGLAKATALDPEILFLEDPTVGLDPLGARRMGEWLLRLRDDLGATVVLVSNDLATVLATADDAVFLDGENQTMTARGNPASLRDHSPDPKVRAFLGAGRP